MKKLLIAMLVISCLMLCLVSCGGDDEIDNTPGGTVNPPTESGGGDVNPPAEKTKFTITWMNENGTSIGTTSVEEGTVPSQTYSVTDTAEWDYTFVGWSATAGGEVLTSIPAASENATYYAVVSAVKRTYTVTFNSVGGSNVESQTVEYGSTATMPANPRKDGFKFVGWSISATETTAVDFGAPITGNVEYFAVWNEVVDVKGLLSALLSGYQFNPYYYIPETMRMDYSANLVDADDIITDYSASVNISDITYGFGEQWYMVLDNLQQTNAFFNVLSVVETLSTSSITAFNNYFDQNPANTAHHEFTSGIYNVTIDFDGETIYYVLDYTTTVPVFGEQTVQIALAMDAESGEKAVRIQAGDANALTYTVTENSYEFAIKYLGIRRAMFTIERDADGNIFGTINEFLGIDSAMVSSAADFYITEDYVSVVGNKASGMLLFTGYICELYSTQTGKMCGYEINETLSMVNYDTLWFNLSDLGGVTSIRYQAGDDSTDAAFFINGSSTAWKAKKNILSRRFDIEFRTQYVYSYDPLTDEYTVHEIQVPMLFVQEDNFDTLIDDVKSTNKIDITVNVTEADLNKVMEDYDTLIPVFIERKDLITPEIIVAYIGEKITFEVI